MTDASRLPERSQSPPPPQSPAASTRIRRRRRALRLLAGVAVAALVATGYRQWSADDESHLRRRIETARSAGRLDEATIYLEKLLDRNPSDGRSRKMLAEVSLEQTRIERKDADFADDRRALHHLQLAADLLPDDLELQRRLIDACLARRDYSAATAAAERVAAKFPRDPDASFVLLGDAVDRRDAAQILPRLERLIDHVLTAPAAPVSPTRKPIQDDLLVEAVSRSPDATTARSAADKLLSAYETLAARPADSPQSLADDVARLMLAAATAVRADDAAAFTALADWADLDVRAERLRAAGIVAGPCAPEVYYQMAAAAFARNDLRAGLTFVDSGLAARTDARLLREGAELDPPIAERNTSDLRLLAAHQLLLRRRYDSAEPYLQAMADDPAAAGDAALLSGWSALVQNKTDLAQAAFARARKLSGDVAPVRMGQVGVDLAARRWRSAADGLRTLQGVYDRLPAGDRAWSARFFGPGRAGLHYCQLFVELKTGRWRNAQTEQAALEGTPLELKGEALVVSELWTSGAKSMARERLADARCRHPFDVGLLSLDLSLLIKEGREEDAHRELERFAAAVPEKDVRSRLLLAGWRLRHGRAADARADLAELERRLPKTEAFKAVALMQAETALVLGRNDEALQLVEPLRSDPLAGFVAGVFSAVGHARLSQPDEAEAALVGAAQFHPESVLLTHLRGEISAYSKNWNVAVEQLSASLDVDTLRRRGAELLAGACRELAKQQPTAEVLAQVDRLLERAPLEPPLLLVRAELLLQQGRLETAEQTLNRLERIGPADAERSAAVAELWLVAQQPRKALPAAQRGLQTSPWNRRCQLAAARSALALGDANLAIEYLNPVLTAEPGLLEAQLLRAAAAERLGRRFEAQRWLESAVGANPRSADAHLALGRHLELAGQLDPALQAYRQGSARLPEELRLRRGELRLLIASGRLSEAHQTADQVAAASPGPATLIAVGEAFEARDQFTTAQGWFRRATSASDSKLASGAWLLLAMSIARQHQGKLPPEALTEVRQSLEAALRSDPRNLVAANNLAWILAHDLERPDEAARVLDEARLGASPALWPSTYVHTLAVVYRKAGRSTEARELVEQSLRIRPGQPRLWLELGESLIDGPERGAAQHALQQALALGLSAPDARRARELLARLDPH